VAVVLLGVRAERLPARPRRPDPHGPWLSAEHWLVVEQPASVAGVVPSRRFLSVMVAEAGVPMLVVARGLN
jgi:hypothetical protein